MICEFCGGKTTRKRVRKVHWLQRQLYNEPATAQGTLRYRQVA